MFTSLCYGHRGNKKITVRVIVPGLTYSIIVLRCVRAIMWLCEGSGRRRRRRRVVLFLFLLYYNTYLFTAINVNSILSGI